MFSKVWLRQVFDTVVKMQLGTPCALHQMTSVWIQAPLVSFLAVHTLGSSRWRPQEVKYLSRGKPVLSSWNLGSEPEVKELCLCLCVFQMNTIKFKKNASVEFYCRPVKSEFAGWRLSRHDFKVLKGIPVIVIGVVSSTRLWSNIYWKAMDEAQMWALSLISHRLCFTIYFQSKGNIATKTW